MQILKYSIAMSVIASLILSGCAKKSESVYLKQSQQAKPLKMPTGVNLKDEQNYYPIPSTAKDADVSSRPPSMVPPGSNLQRFNQTQNTSNTSNVSTVEAKEFSKTKWSQDTKGKPVLVVMEKQKQAWEDVGKALKASHYQVLDKDQTMFSYYILDIKATNNQITQKTPIYRVYVQKDTDGTSHISLLSEKNSPVNSDISKLILKTLEQHFA